MSEKPSITPRGRYPRDLVGDIEFDALRKHVYDYKDKGDKPSDPGWHTCTCKAWQGYWSEHARHVAEEVVAYFGDWLRAHAHTHDA